VVKRGICGWSDLDLDLKPHLVLIYHMSIATNPDDVGPWIQEV